jgi:anti-sigma factor RsiW
VTSGTAELSCQELVELVTDYLEGALSDSERTRFEDHVSRCVGCQNYLAQMRDTVRIVGRLAPSDVDVAAEETLLEAFRGWKSG